MSLTDDLHKKGTSAEMQTALEKMQRSMEDWGNSTRRLQAGSDELNRLLDSMKKGRKTADDMVAKMVADVDQFQSLLDELDAILSAPPSPSYNALPLWGKAAALASLAKRTCAEGSIQRSTNTTEGIDNGTNEGIAHNDEQHYSDTAASHSQVQSSNDTETRTIPSQSPGLPEAATPPETLTYSPPLPITDLVTDLPTNSAPSLDLTGIQTSKHHPDFRIRNQPKMLKLATILSDLHLHLSAAHRNEDQAAFNTMHARITAAGEGLSSLAVAMPAEKKDGAKRLSGGETWEIEKTRQKKEREWYGVQHGCAVEEGGEHDGLSLDRVKRAREVWEAKLDRSEGEVEAESDVAVEAESETEWQEESEETTLVDGVEVLPVLQRTTSAALD
jgi:hypothetical protein